MGHQFDDGELIDYVLGTVGQERAKIIEQVASQDPELAAQLAVMQSLCSDYAPRVLAQIGSIDASSARTGRGWRHHPRVIAALILVGLLAAGAGGAWEILTNRPLLEDDFSERMLHPAKWMCLRPFVSAENGYLRLRDRGYIVSIGEFRDPISLEFDWRPLDLRGHAHYLDILTVALRTTGTPRAEHSYEAEDGILVKFDAHGGNVSVSVANPATGQIEPLAVAPAMSTPIPSGQWHHIRITDNAEQIQVFLSGPQVLPNSAAAPVLEVRYTGATIGTRIAIYNREPLAGVAHESHVDNFSLRDFE